MSATTDGTTVSLRLAAREPFDGVGVLQNLADHAITGVERVVVGAEGSVERLLDLPHGRAHVRVTLDSERAGVRVTARLHDVADVAPLTTRVRRWFDLDADASAIDEALGVDALLGPLVKATPGIRIPGAIDPAEALLRTMVGQQISLASARTVLGRISQEISARAGRAADGDGLLPFPTPAEFAEHGLAVLRGPATRVSAIYRVSTALADGDLALEVGLSATELRERLLAQPGVGRWTADCVTLRALGSPDILLSTDLVVLRVLRELGAADTASRAAHLGERWAPWRSYATMHLWRASTMPLDLALVEGAG